MAIEIREFVGAESVYFNQAESSAQGLNLTEWHAEEMIDPDSIMVDIEGIHSIITRNYTYYEPNCLKESVPYWTNPYGIPVIMHHKERDGVTIGRIKAAEYTDKQTRSGTPALIFTINVPDEEGKKAIKNGTLSTVSIGAIAHDVRCSICGANLAEHGLCEHEKGEMYDDKLCYWIIKKIEPKELSYVIVPSDKYAHNLRVYKPQQAVKAKVVGESLNQSEVKSRMLENPFADIKVVEATEEDKVVKAKKEETQPKEDPKTEPVKEEPVKEEPVKEEPVKEEPKVEETKEEVKIDEEVKGEEKGEIKEEEPKEDEPKEEEKEDEKQDSEKDEKIKELEKEVEALKGEIEKLHKKVDSEKKLRESAENELIGFRLEKKKALVEEVNSLRLELNLTAEDPASLMESSEESLGLTIKNLKEFNNVAKNILNIPKINSNVAVSEDMDNTSKEIKSKEVKETKEDSNIDLMEQAINILTNAWK